MTVGLPEAFVRSLTRVCFKPTPLYRQAVEKLTEAAGGPSDVERFFHFLRRTDASGVGVWRLATQLRKDPGRALEPPPRFRDLPPDFRRLLTAYCRSPWYARLLRRWVVPVYCGAVSSLVGYAVLVSCRHAYRKGVHSDWNWLAFAFSRCVLLLGQMDELLRAWMAETKMAQELQSAFHRMIIASGHVTATLRHASSLCRQVVNRTTYATDPLLVQRSLLRTGVLGADFLFAVSAMLSFLAAGGAESTPEPDLADGLARFPVLYPRLHEALARWYAPPSLGSRPRPASIYLPQRGRTPFWEHPSLEQALDGGQSLLSELPARLKGLQALVLNDIDLEAIGRRISEASAKTSFETLTDGATELLAFGHAVWRMQNLSRHVSRVAYRDEDEQPVELMDRAQAIDLLWQELPDGPIDTDTLVVAALSILSLAAPRAGELQTIWQLVERPGISPAHRWAAFVTFARLVRLLYE